MGKTAKRWQIRVAVAGDAPALQACMEAAYSAYESRLQGQSLPPLEADYAQEIQQFPTWVLELDGELAGGLIMSFDSAQARLMNIALSPRAQGRGLGRELMAFAEATARERHCTTLSLATHELLTENAALYQHLGWRHTDTRDSRLFFEKVL